MHLKPKDLAILHTASKEWLVATNYGEYQKASKSWDKNLVDYLFPHTLKNALITTLTIIRV